MGPQRTAGQTLESHVERVIATGRDQVLGLWDTDRLGDAVQRELGKDHDVGGGCFGRINQLEVRGQSISEAIPTGLGEGL